MASVTVVQPSAESYDRIMARADKEGPEMAQRRCQTCKRKFTRPVGSNRLNCFVCRPSRALNVVQIPPKTDGDELSLTTLCKEALADAGVLDTWQGAAAIKLAQLIDAGRHGASGPAGTVKAHREAMAIALAEANKPADVVSMIFAGQD